ncbi:Adenylate and Guanylate cyclase catalytic domain containing protein [Trichomonas vaginalis G3]|uniref:Adenylate and Guanylate cyclase catalytic domain containing protein n=1 Tax=Trichomonas vaginalis (strain ATCC PRA-98 / G3) TaxID=412133 RepID=A2FFZ6_TRIV3|nr:guanylate cyclase protein [Trichomonas vaginalis G3]EAX96158.1 Adenylate and Guanylate cyclase catalytic domain containing protein [Trichomonas vaginalis G3]KAI5495094.1 guanylate cyclase protein [Trichomonas vaginalis G3]|eukprot:XP_001309088.1 Adenylate and Guanylate cyclase catalytic domain containing protein [Trichomonas vaginalis G3]
MLGQQITNFVCINDQKQIKSQLKLMTSGQGSLVWQDHIELINDLGKSVPFSVTMIGMKDNDNSNELNSIVFILTNETGEIKKRTAAENAKQRSEKLLYQIHPKDIVVRLNRGEKDISFTIPQATIFFIDIVKFSVYSSSLTPGEIMSNLSLVFSTFDKIVSKYDQITKIKLIGDVYMAAAGLFQSSDNNDHKMHAIQSVKCCLDVQRIMDDINTKPESSLEVRIGINTGGPLIGGVLGTDKPTFDIIGDPINIASRLQSTDIPGRVQISQDTKEIICDMDFIIEERGEVYLKGKGNRTTYFVRYPNKELATESFAINMFSGKI